MYTPDDLEPLERVVLGVMCVGLPPSRAAGDDTFRVDHVAAVAAALADGGERSAYLREDGIRATPEFRARLRSAIESLEAKGLVTSQAPGMPAAPGGYEAGLAVDLVDPDEHPVVLDRYLAQQCMETLFQQAAVYPFLIERYASSGEVWRRLRDQGYGA